MQKQEIYAFMTENPVFSLATMDNDFPRVRGMLLFRADQDGIVFHTGVFKDLYRQVKTNPNVELCFMDTQLHQVRVSGALEIVEDNALKDEIAEHPSRAFVKQWRESGALQDFYNSFVVMRLKGGKAKDWTMEKNMQPVEEILLD